RRTTSQTAAAVRAMPKGVTARSGMLITRPMPLTTTEKSPIRPTMIMVFCLSSLCLTNSPTAWGTTAVATGVASPGCGGAEASGAVTAGAMGSVGSAPAVRSVTSESFTWRTRAPHFGHLIFRFANLSSTEQVDLHDGQVNWIKIGAPYWPQRAQSPQSRLLSVSSVANRIGVQVLCTTVLRPASYP